MIEGDEYRHSFLYKNIFYKNIEAEICEILRIFSKNNAKAQIWKRIDIILCVGNICKYNKIFFVTLKGETSQQTEKPAH